MKIIGCNHKGEREEIFCTKEDFIETIINLVNNKSFVIILISYT